VFTLMKDTLPSEDIQIVSNLCGTVTLLWKPTERLPVTPSYFRETSTQNGISAYDSVPGTETHYQPFDIAEPLTDSLTAYSLNVNYSFPTFDLTSSTARWTRNSTQVEEASEAFNNPLDAIAYNYNGSSALSVGKNWALIKRRSLFS
jgi:hypothetical protein